MHESGKGRLVELVTEIVVAQISHNDTRPDEIPNLIATTHAALFAAAMGAAAAPAETMPEPAVSIRASVKPDHIVCLEDGKKLKMLKRHLMTRYQMTPDQYRARWGLGADYPMVAPNYAEKRRELAKSIGLGRGGHQRGRTAAH